ncbi:transposase, partial [Alistipes sp. Z76]|nr:transposase [Alistipes sp. Z76]NCE71274.1 transposase [Muribaculaceae bacterium M3]
MPKYTVLDKDTIKKEIMPYLSVAKRGYVSQGSLIEVVNAILHKLKSGCQWHQLPVGHLFGDVVLSWNAVYHHFRKWCRLGEWQTMFAALVRKYKDRLDMSVTHIDGSHTPALKGGENVEYQGRKKRKTTNSLYFCDRQGLPLAMSEPQKGNHADLYEIEQRVDELAEQIRECGLRTDGLFNNADAGFDAKAFRLALESHEIIANVCPNRRNGEPI